MVGRTVDTLGQMQYQEQMQMMDTTYRVGYRWWQTLGGDIDLKNPETGTIWWNTDAGYHYYCETPQQAILGSDNYLALREAPDCRTMLKQVTRSAHRRSRTPGKWLRPRNAVKKEM